MPRPFELIRRALRSPVLPNVDPLAIRPTLPSRRYSFGMGNNLPSLQRSAVYATGSVLCGSSTERPCQRQAERNCAKPEANSPSNFEEKFPIHDASSARESAVTAWHGIGGLGIIQNESGYE